MPTPLPVRRIFLWLGIAALLVAAGAVTGRAVLRAKAKHTPVAAYLVPRDNEGRIKPAWWRAQRLDFPRPLAAGERIRIPAGTRVTLIHSESGVAELVAGPAKLLFQQKLPAETNALVSPLPEAIASAKGAITTPPGACVITSPVGMTRYLNPLITWVAREGVLYDVAVADSADPFVPLRKAFGVRPPVALADLQTPQRHQLGFDRNYEILIREANASTLAGAARFLTTTDAQLETQIPTAPADLIAEATAAMAKKPARTGDAWLALSHLPPEWATSELGVRLRLRVAAELGLADELDRALKDAARLDAW
jgi:hypothetical protein